MFKCPTCGSKSLIREVSNNEGCIYWKCDRCLFVWKTDRYGRMLDEEENNSTIYEQMKKRRCKELEEIKNLADQKKLTKNDLADIKIDIWRFENSEKVYNKDKEDCI